MFGINGFKLRIIFRFQVSFSSFRLHGSQRGVIKELHLIKVAYLQLLYGGYFSKHWACYCKQEDKASALIQLVNCGEEK